HIAGVIQKNFSLKNTECSLAIYRETNFGDHVEYHIDTTRGAVVTALIFINSEWEENFHGETQFIDEQGVGIAILPSPGRVILFDSGLRHSASTPSRICYEARKVLVLDFKEEKV